MNYIEIGLAKGLFEINEDWKNNYSLFLNKTVNLSNLNL